MSAFTRVVLAFVLFMVSSACSGSLSPEDQTSLGQVRAMLRQRAMRLLAGDVDGYLAPVGPDARALEETIARGATSVPLASIDLVFVPPRDVSIDADAFHAVPVEFIFRYTGLPEDNRFSFTLTQDFEKQDGHWVVSRSEPESGGRESPRLPLWATGPVEVTRSAHFLTLSRPGVSSVDRMVALAEEGRSRLGQRITVSPDAAHLMILARNNDELGELARRDFSEGTLAFAQGVGRFGEIPRNRQLVVDADAVLSTETAVSEDGVDVTPRQVFQHELAHLALARFRSPSRPVWLEEGAAMYLSEERREGAWSDAQYRLLAEDVDLALLDRSDLPGELYPYANAAILYLVELAGPQRFWEFYRSFNDLAEARAPSARNTARVLDRFYQIDHARLGAATQQWMHNQILVGS